MDRMRKMAGRLDRLFQVLQIACSVAAVAAGVGLLLIAACFIFKLDPEQIGTGYNLLDIGFLELEIAAGFAPDPHSVLVIGAVDMAMSVVLALLGYGAIGCIRRLLTPMREGMPFHAEASGSLKRLAILSLVIGVVLNLSEIANQLLTAHIYDLASLLAGGKIAAVVMHHKLDPGCLVIAGVLLLLSYIFRYGQELQQLSDETL